MREFLRGLIITVLVIVALILGYKWIYDNSQKDVTQNINSCRSEGFEILNGNVISEPQVIYLEGNAFESQRFSKAIFQFHVVESEYCEGFSDKNVIITANDEIFSAIKSGDHLILKCHYLYNSGVSFKYCDLESINE